MKPITIIVDDVKLTLKSLEQNKTYKCDCFGHSFGCPLKQQLSNTPSEPSFVVTEAIINVRNTSNEEWIVDSQCWELIDTDGYAYKARALCDALRPARTIEPTSSNRSLSLNVVTAGTQSDFVLVFPEIEQDKKIGSISYSDRSVSCSFEICEMNPDASDLILVRKMLQETDSDLRFARRKRGHLRPKVPQMAFSKSKSKPQIGLGASGRFLDDIEEKMHTRLNELLPRNDAEKLEKHIEKFSNGFKLMLENEQDNNVRKILEERFNNSFKNYEIQLVEVKKREDEKMRLDKEFEQLYGLTPREFEEYVANVFKHLGFEKVTLKPVSNDKGIDILAEEKGAIVAIQCKRWTKQVGHLMSKSLWVQCNRQEFKKVTSLQHQHLVLMLKILLKKVPLFLLIS